MYINRLSNFNQIASMLRSGRCLPTHVAAHCLQIRFVCCTRYWLSLAAPTKKFVHPETLFLREVAELHRAKISSVTCHRSDLGTDCPMGSDKCNYKLIGSMLDTLLGW